MTHEYDAELRRVAEASGTIECAREVLGWPGVSAGTVTTPSAMIPVDRATLEKFVEGLEIMAALLRSKLG